MGENLFEGVVSLSIGDKPIEYNKEPVSLEYEVPDMSPLAVFDPASKAGDSIGINVLHNGSIEVSFSIKNDDNPLGKWYWSVKRRFEKIRKLLFFAVTHGYIIRIPVEANDGERGYWEITKPSLLRLILKSVPFIPQFYIVDKSYAHYTIKNGRIIPVPVWPVAQKLIDMYEEEYEKSKGRI